MTQAFPGQNISSVTVITRPKQSLNNKIYDYKLKRIIELHACDEISGRHYYRKMQSVPSGASVLLKYYVNIFYFIKTFHAQCL